jgi:hypothetical protein
MFGLLIYGGKLFGLVTGLGFFTYPGFFLFVVALFIAIGIALLAFRINFLTLADWYPRYIICDVLATTLICIAVWLAHSFIYSDGSFLFQGGGKLQ